MISYEEVFDNNKNWISEKTGSDGNYFDTLAKGQNPEILYIGCADSRVTAEEFMGAGPGEIFVHRNVANVVSVNDDNSAAVIEYAVAHLKVRHVAVCGHTNCGGVKAAMTSDDMGMLNPWLRNIRDVYRLHKAELDGISNEDERYDRLVELNVQEQCLNVMKMPVVHKTIKEGGNLKIHGWVFDIRTGQLKDLGIDVQGLYKEVESIYGLH